VRSSAPARVAHVLPTDARRGAQVFAHELRQALDGRPDRHFTITLFAGPPAGEPIAADVRLGLGTDGHRRPRFHPGATLGLRRAVRGSDAVVAHGGEALLHAATATPWSVPVVYTKIGGSAQALRGPVHRALWSAVTRRARAIVAVSPEMADEVGGLLGVDRARITLIPNGRDPSVFHPGTGRRERPHLVHVGALTADKRPEAFVRLVALLRAEGLDLDASLVGAGPLLASLRSPAAEAGVALLGPRADIAELLRQADLLVLTSRVEGMPGVLIEAGMSGLAVVTTRVPGASLVVRDGETGSIVEAGDDAALLAATRSLVLDPERRGEMGRAARDHCVRRFSLATVAASWQEVLDGVLERPARAQRRG